jgi:hypothetical protein
MDNKHPFHPSCNAFLVIPLPAPQLSPLVVFAIYHQPSTHLHSPHNRHSTFPRLAQVSEKILQLDAEAREARMAASQAADRSELLTSEKNAALGAADELRTEVAAKLALLDEFEERFQRQYRHGVWMVPAWS